MSELTPCNHCTLSRIRFHATKIGQSVELKQEWLNHAPGEEWTAVYVEGKRIAMFMELTDYCCC